jgi:CheY-like chemotaxis protein
MLKEGLENSGHYSAQCVHTGSDALQAVVEENFDLVIIDVALTDMSPGTLIKAVHEAKNELKIMVIPLIGQAVPQSIEELGINGVLTKPFFVGDLPDLIDEALGRRTSPSFSPPPSAPPVSADARSAESSGVASQGEPAFAPVAELVTEAPPAVVVTVSSDTVRYLRANEAEILRLLDDLNREVRAEAILLIAGAELIAQAGMLAREQCQQLARLVAQSAQAAAQAAHFLGEPAGRFTQSLHEGEAYRLYSLSLGEGIVLSLALSSNVPLGMIRHQCRQIATQLGRYI